MNRVYEIKLPVEKLTSRDIVEIFEDFVDLKCQEREGILDAAGKDFLEVRRRQLSDIIKLFDPRGGVAVFGKDDLK